MSASTALMPTEQREVTFYEDTIVAVLVPGEGADELTVFVPIRPICDQLGLTWSGQFERIKRDPILSEVTQGVRVIRTPDRGGEQEMLCIPIEYLNGWLFGVSAARVKDALRDKLLRYQRDCYKVLWGAFQPGVIEALRQRLEQDSVAGDLEHVRLAVDGVLDYLWRHEQHEQVVRQLLETLRRGMRDLQLDVHDVGGLIEEGDVLTERQRQTLYQLGLEIAYLMGQLGERRNSFAIVFGGVKRRFEVDTYRHIPRRLYREAYEYLEHWKGDIQRQIREGGKEPFIP